MGHKVDNRTVQVRIGKYNADKLREIHTLNKKRYPGIKVSDTTLVNMLLSKPLSDTIDTIKKEMKTT